MASPPKINTPSPFANDAEIPTAVIEGDISSSHTTNKDDPSTGPGAYGMSIARVLRVDYVLQEVSLQVMSGERDVYDLGMVPTTSPAGGSRHFIGAMPEAGDLCVVGWMAGYENKQPIILRWLPTAAGAGIDWKPVQDFQSSEVDMNPKTRTEFEGIYGRYRMKYNPVRPGCIMMSSSKGSDLSLDEDVLISNRRANEILLRDADQALVTRSLQQFHTMGGARIYGGMVQRDAQFLPRRMLSSGANWEAKTQVSEDGTPLPVGALGDSAYTRDSLTPHPVFARSDASFPFADSGIQIEPNTDPYAFLSQGLLIGPDGVAVDGSRIRSSGEYGGKPYFRVAIDADSSAGTSPHNGAIAQGGTNGDTLTEYRIELEHSWDGTLPVSEQTDGFDADSLPSNAVGSSPTSSSDPYIRWVLGSVVGNDPFTARGSALYGLPLAPHIFDSDGTVDPHMDSGVGKPLGDHAASLFQVTPPVVDPSIVPPMFVSTTKDGRVKAFLSGPQNQNSLELACGGGIGIRSQGPTTLDVGSLALNFRNGDPLDNWGFKVQSETGAILLQANAPTTRGSFSARTGTNDMQENQLPAIAVESPNGNVHMTAGRVAKVSGANAIQLTDTNELLIQSKQLVNVLTDKKLLQANTYDKTVQGKEVQLYSGPLNFLPTNGPIRETTFAANPSTGHAGGVTDKYLMVFGDRQERFTLGNHRTTCVVGNITHETLAGKVSQEAGANSVSVSTIQGINMKSTSTTSMVSTLSTSISALSSITLRTGGTARLSGSVTTLGGIGLVGRIISSADLDPLTNLPFSFYGMGSPGHRLGAPI